MLNEFKLNVFIKIIGLEFLFMLIMDINMIELL